jgi:secondary thiamine-phosphate synthase enzyme
VDNWVADIETEFPLPKGIVHPVLFLFCIYELWDENGSVNGLGKPKAGGNGTMGNAEHIINKHKILEFLTKGGSQIVDVTGEVQSFLSSIQARQVVVTVSVVGSTAGISTVEYEPGLLRDIPEMLDKVAPEGRYHHDDTWQDGNGHSHLRSTLIGTSQTFPVLEGQAALGTWQQIILIDFDNRPRKRVVVVQYLGQ